MSVLLSDHGFYCNILAAAYLDHGWLNQSVIGLRLSRSQLDRYKHLENSSVKRIKDLKCLINRKKLTSWFFSSLRLRKSPRLIVSFGLCYLLWFRPKWFNKSACTVLKTKIYHNLFLEMLHLLWTLSHCITRS